MFVAQSTSTESLVEHLSALEQVSIGQAARTYYKREAEGFLNSVASRRMDVSNAGLMDVGPVSYFNSLHFSGHPAWNGEKCLAAAWYCEANLSKSCCFSLPRTWRALKG